MKYIEYLSELNGVKNDLFRIVFDYNYLSVVSNCGRVMCKIDYKNFKELSHYGFTEYRLLSEKYNLSTIECKIGIVPLYVDGEWKYGKKISDNEIAIIGNLDKKLKEHGFKSRFYTDI